MKRDIVLAGTLLLLTAAILSGTWLPVTADDTEGVETSQARVSVALLDVKQVFKKYRGLAEDLQQIKTDIASAELEFNEQKKVIGTLNGQLAKMQKGTPDYIDLQQLIATDGAKLKALIERKKAEFLQRESDAYADSYDKLTEVVNAYARDQHIQLVLRHTDDDIDRDDRKSVLQAVNRAIIFEDGLDITEAITGRMNAK